jgi:uncharacterized membrane protein
MRLEKSLDCAILSVMNTRLTALASKPVPDNGFVYMDAELRPNRSLSANGFKIVMLSMASMSFVTGLGFLSIGAWPVVGFFGLDVLLIYLAFKVNFKSGERERETVRVTAAQIAISRTCYRGHIGWWHVSPTFARVQVEQLNDYEAAVHLTAGGTSVPLATCLSPPERLAFAEALKDALDQARNERYATASVS